MDKITFARLVSFVSAMTGREMDQSDVEHLDGLTKPSEPCRVDPVVVNALLAAMGQEGQKIPAIKEYRTLTGADVLTSKNAVERYWYGRTGGN